MMIVERLSFKDGNGNNYPDWKFTKLSKIGYFKTSSVDKKNIPTEQEVFLVNYMDVYNHLSLSNKAKNNLMKVTAKASQLKENNLLRGDILFTPSSETPDDIGHSVVVYEDLINTVYSYHLVRYRTTIQLDLNYAHYFCNTQDLLKQMSILSQGATRFTLSLKSFNSLKTKISQDIKEQEKIGNFLSLFDRLIEKLETKIGLLEELKKGYLQQMFPSKGEKVPKIRFLGFDGDWETITILNLLNYKRPDPFIVSNDNYSNEFNTPVLTANKGFLLGYTNETQTFNDECIIFDDFTLDNKFVDFPFMVKSSAIKILVNRDGYNLYFVYNLFKTVRFDVIGHARHYISIVQQTKVKSPNMNEQEKIGDFFKSLDSLIEKQEKELNSIEHLKKGYMQRLFA